MLSCHRQSSCGGCRHLVHNDSQRERRVSESKAVVVVEDTSPTGIIMKSKIGTHFLHAQHLPFHFPLPSHSSKGDSSKSE